jgi:hypothetical protein
MTGCLLRAMHAVLGKHVFAIFNALFQVAICTWIRHFKLAHKLRLINRNRQGQRQTPGMKRMSGVCLFSRGAKQVFMPCPAS